ncbi:MAG: SurA N-terminal domain-containing protein [Proteobacteria bacterium]|nr:SurA N-terminal domain-containing protein [Pseudomonadota bacterium]
MKKMHLYPVTLSFVILLVLFTACHDDIQLFENEPLITSGSTVITVGDYMNALEVTKTAYPHSVIVEKESFTTIKTRLLSQMIEELVIMKIAQEKNIKISDEEFKTALDDIKKDYPEGVFEEMLLENAITNHLWETRLRNRLLMQKVQDAEFDSKISISPENMKEYYEKNAKDIESEFDEEQDEGDVYDRIIKRMRMEKKQGAYQTWIDQKKADYSIEVNQKIWEKILGS